jgi:hypothetical protein
MEDNVTKPSRFENILFTLAFFSLLLPPGAQYLLLLCLLIRTVVARTCSPWRKVLNIGGRWFIIALSANVIILLLLGLTWYVREPGFANQIKSDYAHVMAKQFLWPMIMIWTVGCAYERGWRIRQGLWFLTVLLAIHFAYVLVQRYYGINWVKGFGSFLPENRFAYGVYRVSGFMSHPLNLAYNLMLFCLFSYFLAFKQPRSADSPRWALIFALGGLNLLVTASRSAILLTLLFIFVCERHRIWRFKKIAVGAIAAIALLLAMEQSTLKRFSELSFDSDRIVETMPRIGFWKIHWQMFADHPVLGVGLHNRVSGSLDYYSRAGYTEKENKYRAHNIFLQTLADSGIVGFAGLLAFLWGIWRFGYDKTKAYGTGAFLVIFLATLACSFVDNTLRDSEFIFALFYVLVINKLSLDVKTEA